MCILKISEVSVILLIVSAVITSSLAVTYEILLPANFAETELSKVENKLSENFNEDFNTYFLFDVLDNGCYYEQLKV